MGNHVPVDAFMEEKPKLAFEKDYSLEVKAKELGSHFGWQGSKPNQSVKVMIGGAVVKAQVMTSATVQLSGASGKTCTLNLKRFLASAKSMDISDMAKAAKARKSG